MASPVRAAALAAAMCSGLNPPELAAIPVKALSGGGAALILPARENQRDGAGGFFVPGCCCAPPPPSCTCAGTPPGKPPLPAGIGRTLAA